MKQGSPQLVLNCPKCNSGRLTFNRQEDKTAKVGCLDCKHEQDSYYATALAAVSDWNKRGD